MFVLEGGVGEDSLISGEKGGRKEGRKEEEEDKKKAKWSFDE